LLTQLVRASSLPPANASKKCRFRKATGVTTGRARLQTEPRIDAAMSAQRLRVDRLRRRFGFQTAVFFKSRRDPVQLEDPPLK
jgi:hypothetical protein